MVSIMLIVRDGRRKERKGQYFNTTEASSPRPQKSQGLLGTGRRGGRGYGGGGREIIYLSLHCHHQNDSRIKVGNDESHFNVS